MNRRLRSHREAFAMNELCDKSAVDLVALLAARQVSCVEVMDAHLAQIDRVNPRLNAIVTLTAERARATAAQFDADPPTRCRRCGAFRPRTKICCRRAACARHSARRCTPTTFPIATT